LAAILLGFMVASWLFTLGAVSYALWRYCYKPWLVLRADITALKQLHDEQKQWVKNEFGLRAARSLSDEELFRMEAVQRRVDGRSRVGL
jgi:hypothetical protein